MKTTIRSVLTIIALASLALLPKAPAVVPSPDGGYPGFNTAEGTNALKNLTTGVGNAGVGWYSLFSNTDGSFNTALGAGTLVLNAGNQTTGEGLQNTAVGTAALLFNTIGSDNTAIGVGALQSNTEGDGNVAVGETALSDNTTGFRNIAVGWEALRNNTTGISNIAVGFRAGINVSTAIDVIAIGASGQNVNGSCFIGQIYNNVQPIVGIDPDYVTITSAGRLGRGSVSSRRYKHDINPMDRASEALYALKPVSFRYHKEYDATQTLAFGLIAEEVAEVYPDLVGRNREGQPESVRYEQINAMLLNEFLKEHRKVQQQEDRIVKLEGTVGALTAQLREQAAQVQKVSAQMEVGQPSSRTVLNDRGHEKRPIFQSEWNPKQ